MSLKSTLIFIFHFCFALSLCSQHSVARQWNEALLEAIRKDFARPTVHARNLFHTSIAMYDAWAVYDEIASPFLLGNSVNGFQCDFTGIQLEGDLKEARNEAISYASYRLLRARFINSPNAFFTLAEIDELMNELGYDKSFSSIDYSAGSPAALGNYIAQCVLSFGLQDRSNELDFYENQYYEPVNPPLVMKKPGNPDILDFNRWQPLTLDVFIDQSGNEIPFNTPDFLSPEWGIVTPFALEGEDLTIYNRGKDEYWVYHDPGSPAYLDTSMVGGISEEYKWGFSLVSIWSSHLDPNASEMIDISPASFGNITDYPTSIEGLRDFYNFKEGGDAGKGMK